MKVNSTYSRVIGLTFVAAVVSLWITINYKTADPLKNISPGLVYLLMSAFGFAIYKYRKDWFGD